MVIDGDFDKLNYDLLLSEVSQAELLILSYTTAQLFLPQFLKRFAVPLPKYFHSLELLRSALVALPPSVLVIDEVHNTFNNSQFIHTVKFITARFKILTVSSPITRGSAFHAFLCSTFFSSELQFAQHTVTLPVSLYIILQ